MSAPYVLIVEDEPDIANLIDFHLTRNGFETKIAPTGEEAMMQVERKVPDLVVLDIMLPGVDGLEVCRRIKRENSKSHIPIIMVSARGEESDVVVGLELGADDYVTKPFSPRVLLARVSAVLRRHEVQNDHTEKLSVADGKIVIDAARHQVTVMGEEIQLTLTEYRLLHYLATRPGFVRTREQIISAVRGEGTVLSSRAVDVHIAGLRNKLGDLSTVIETVRGIGYRLTESSTVPAN